MPKCRVLKGGWFWKDAQMKAGDVIENVSPEWIANRVADGELVEPIAEEPEIETATAKPQAETAVSPRGRAKGK